MDSHHWPEQWKPRDTEGNHRGVQKEISSLSVLPKPTQLPSHIVERCSFTGALNHCLLHAGREANDVANSIHVSKGYLSKLMTTVWEQQLKRLVRFMRETHCVAPLQKLADEMGYQLTVKAPSEEEVLEQRLAEIRAKRSA